MAVVDTPGCLVCFRLVPGQAHDLAGLPPLPGGLDIGAPAGDKAFDADWLAEDLEARGCAAAASSKSNSNVRRDRDGEMYEWRRQIKNFVVKIREFRAIATHCDKTIADFHATINLVAGVIAARQCQENRGY